MTDTGYKPGDRISHPRWGIEGTVTQVFDDGGLAVKFDGTSFTETEVELSEVDQIPGTGNSSIPYEEFVAAVMSIPEPIDNCPGCVGRGIGPECVVCDRPIPDQFRRTRNSPSEYLFDCSLCLKGAQHIH